MEDLAKLRKEIDAADKKLLEALKERFDVCIRIAQWKKKEGIEITDSSRENLMIQKRTEQFASLGFNDLEFIKKIYSSILDKSKQIQKEVQEEN